MKRLDRNIGTFQRATKKTPEVLHSVRVNLSLDVFFRVIHKVIHKAVNRKVVTRAQGIAVDRRSLLDIFNHVGTDVIGANIRHYFGAHFNVGNALAQLPGRKPEAIAQFESEP
jgi:hypothetical protein